MNILLTFDYELFFGRSSGSFRDALLAPTNAFLDRIAGFEAKVCFFVDAGYLIALRRERCIGDFEAVKSHVRSLVADGHDVQLHIHPHWQDAKFVNGVWDFDLSRYRLHSFPASQIHGITSDYKNVLEEVAGTDVFAYRAGGWCIQPFNIIADSLYDAGIWLDSTVFAGGYNETSSHYFDFRRAPDLNQWVFDKDVLEAVDGGRFLEIPIANYHYSALYFWRIAHVRVLRLHRHIAYGHGSAAATSRPPLRRLLLQRSHGVASLDGIKSSALEHAFSKWRERQSNSQACFVGLGHPKAFTLFSVNQVAKFIERHAPNHRFTHYRELRDQGAIKRPS